MSAMTDGRRRLTTDKRMNAVREGEAGVEGDV